MAGCVVRSIASSVGGTAASQGVALGNGAVTMTGGNVGTLSTAIVGDGTDDRVVAVAEIWVSVGKTSGVGEVGGSGAITSALHAINILDRQRMKTRRHISNLLKQTTDVAIVAAIRGCNSVIWNMTARYARLHVQRERTQQTAQDSRGARQAAKMQRETL